MSIGLRVMWKRNMLLSEQFKKPLQKIAEIMPIGFTDDDFYSAFCKYYPELIDEANETCQDNLHHNIVRKRHGYKTAYFPYSVQRYLEERSASLRSCLRKRHAMNKIHSDLEIKEIVKRLDTKLSKKDAKRKLRDDYYLQYAQDVCPKYIKNLIQLYFKERRRNCLDVNARYILLLEAAQFRTFETVVFLKKVNACDKNINIRHFAFSTLQSMGYHPWLARKRKGKTRNNAIKPIDITENPTELLEYIYRFQDLLHQKFDVFISHSSYDKAELYKLKRTLNAQGLVVYIDWANDKVMLNRENQNEDTWTVLQKRMDISNKMIFVMTDNSLRSQWAQKEIEYFTKLGKPVFVFQPYEISEQVWDILPNLPKYQFDINI